MSTTPDIGMPNIANQQDGPEVTHNEALLMLQALLVGAITRGDNAPPGAPVVGDCYIVGAAPTSSWAGKANKIALYTGGGWRFVPDVDDAGTDIPMGARHEGLLKYVRSDQLVYVWTGAAWEAFAGTLYP